MKSANAPRTQSNQAEVRSQGHDTTADPSNDVHINMADGGEISRMTNFGVTHAGFIKDSEGTGQTK